MSAFTLSRLRGVVSAQAQNIASAVAVARRRNLPRLVQLLLWTAAFAIAAALVLEQAGASLQNPYARPERAAILRAWDELGGRESDVLFIGDSRSGNAFLPAAVEDELKRAGLHAKSFNLSGPASTVPSDAGVLDYVISRGARPRIVLWGLGKRQASLLDFGSFQRNEATSGLATDLVTRAPSWSNVCTLGFLATSGIRHAFQAPFALLPQYRDQLVAARRNRGIGWAEATDEWGREYNANKMPNAPTTPAEWQRDIAQLKIQKNAVAAFEESATVTEAVRYAGQRVREAGGELVLVNVPMLPARTVLEKQHGYDAYLQWLQRVAARNGLRVLDLNRPPLLPRATDFADTDHLSASGAAALSRQLARTVILPRLQRHEAGAAR